MTGAKGTVGLSDAGTPRTAQAQAILSRHFGLSQSATEAYFIRAAQREGLTVSEIEDAVIRLARELC